MTTITGTIEDSGGTGLTGTLRVTLDGPLVDTSSSPDSVQVPRTKDFAITGGAVNINLTESQTLNLTYRFQFLVSNSTNAYYFANGDLYTGPRNFRVADNNWYTGPVYTVDSVLIYEQAETTTETLLDFHAIVPNVASAEFASLVPTGVTTDVLDTSIRRLAEILTSNVDYIEALRGGPRWMGVYNPATIYQRDDAVSYGGSSWVYINGDPASSQTPSDLNTTYWLKLAQKGDAGGTGGQDTPFDSTGWNGQTWAPTANVLRDYLITLATLASPVFTGTPTCPIPSTADDSTKIINSAWANLWLTDKLTTGLALGGNATATTQTTGDNSTKPATTTFVKAALGRYAKVAGVFAQGTAGGTNTGAADNTRTLNTIVHNNGGDVLALASNTVTLRAGTYIVRAAAPAYNVGNHYLALWNATAGAVVLNGSSEFTSGAVVQSRSIVSGMITIGGNTDFTLRHWTSSSQATNGLGAAVNRTGRQEIYAELEFWRID